MAGSLQAWVRPRPEQPGWNAENGPARRGSPHTAWFLLVTLVAAILSGFYGGHLPILFAEAAGATFLLRLLRDPQAPPVWHSFRQNPVLALWLLACCGTAAMQLALGFTTSPWETHKQLHFFASALLLIPLLSEATPKLASDRGILVISGSLVIYLVASLVAAGVTTSLNGADSAIWWPFVYRNHFAAFVLMGIPALAWVALQRPTLRWLAALALVFALSALLSCGSRSGFVGMIALALCFPLAALRRLANRGTARWMALVLPAGLLLSALLANPELLVWRWEHGGPLLEGRLDYWQASLQMIAAKPILGWGFGTWPDVYLQFMQKDGGLVVNRAHSDFLEYAAEGGVLVLLGLAALLVRSLWLAFRQPWSMGAAMVLLLALADYPLHLPLLLWLLVALLVAAESACQQENSLSPPAVIRFQNRPRPIPVKPPASRGVMPEHGVPESCADR